MHGELVEFADDSQATGLLGQRELEVNAIPLQLDAVGRGGTRGTTGATPQDEKDDSDEQQKDRGAAQRDHQNE